jgi:hypothetical protein
MAFQIRRKGPDKAASHTKEKFEDAIHVAAWLIAERVPRTQTIVVNLKTGETMNEAEIEEAALSVGPLKRRSSDA